MSNKPIVRKKPNVLPAQRRYAPTHQTSEPDPNDRYVVRDKDWEAVWGVNLTLEAAKALKEKTAGSGKSRTVRFELMPTDPEILRALAEDGWPVTLPGAIEQQVAESLVVPPPAPVRTAPVPAPARRTGNGTRPLQNRAPAPPASYTQQAASTAARSAAAAAAAAAQARAVVAMPVATAAPNLALVDDAVDSLVALVDADGEPPDGESAPDGEVAPGGEEPTTLTPEQIAEAEALADELDQMPMDELLGS